MITSINIKNVATYEPEVGVQIDCLKKVNFIYGANGSGKTTISNFILDPADSKYRDCQIKWGNDELLTSYVYNKKFRDQNFFHSDIPGVFTLGKATAEQMAELNRKKAEITELRKLGIDEKRRIKGFEDQLKAEADRFKETIWDSYSVPNKTIFKEAFKNCGTKESFKNRILQELRINESVLISKEALLEKAKTIFGDRPTSIDPLPLLILERLKEIEEIGIWGTSVIGKDDVPIAKLYNRLGNSDWVDKGQKFIQNETCPFCQQETISNDFIKQIEEFFDESYKKALQEVKFYGGEYFEMTNRLIEQLNLLEQRETDKSDTKLDWKTLKTEVELLESQLKVNQNVMAEKLKEPSRKMSLTILTDLYDRLNERIIKANKSIQEHNNIVKNYHEAHRLLVQSTWKWIIEEARPKIRIVCE